MKAAAAAAADVDEGDDDDDDDDAEECNKTLERPTQNKLITLQLVHVYASHASQFIYSTIMFYIKCQNMYNTTLNDHLFFLPNKTHSHIAVDSAYCYAVYKQI